MRTNINFMLSAAYEWPKSKSDKQAHYSQIAIKTLVRNVQSRLTTLSKKTKKPLVVNYRRLRASAGAFLLDSIMNRIISSNAVIIDISSNNPNVHIEMGVALMYAELNPSFRVYLIKYRESSTKKTSQESLLPSDLQGLFVTEYTVSGTQVTFKDNGSLLMSIASDVLEHAQHRDNGALSIDEINWS